MPSYATLAALALVASTISPTQSAPVMEIREQALARGFRPPTKLGGKGGFSLKNIDWKKKLKNAGIALGIGAASTEVGSDIYEYATGGDEVNPPPPEENPSPDAAPPPPSYENYCPTVSERGERALGNNLPVDLFDVGVADGIVTTTTGPSKARFISGNDNQNRRTSSHLDLLSRADLGEALSLFGRMLDELD